MIAWGETDSDHKAMTAYGLRAIVEARTDTTSARYITQEFANALQEA